MAAKMAVGRGILMSAVSNVDETFRVSRYESMEGSSAARLFGFRTRHDMVGDVKGVF